MSVLTILEEIGADSSRTHKLETFQRHSNNDLFMKTVKLALDPFTNFYIRKIPDYVPTNQKTLDWALGELNRLATREFTGHAGIDHLRNILSQLSRDDSVVIERIIGKDLRCGMAEGIVNAIVSGYIPSYPCLLARPYDEKNIKNIVFPAYSQLKADGLRANAIVENGKVTLCGRSGREIDLNGIMDPELIELANRFEYPVVFDGEFVVCEGNTIIDRKTGNGIINKAIKGTISPIEASMIRFQLWDVVSLESFKKGKDIVPYKERFEKLQNAVGSVCSVLRHPPFWIIPYKIVNSLEEAVAHFNLLLENGEEGTILKNFHFHWEDGRSKHLVKMKAEKDCDLEITGWNPGTGQFEGMVGSLICVSSDRQVEVAISGFSIDLRKQITQDINNLIGTIVTVIYNERIKSKDRKSDSLFLPRFAEFRTDKDVANSSNEIK